MIYWLVLGFIGWIVLMLYRIVADGLPKKETPLSYVRGFLLALLLGPFCFSFLGILLIYKVYDDKVDKQ